jgi:hypothetical protein
MFTMRLVQVWVIYGLLGFILSILKADAMAWEFWAVLALCWAASRLQFQQGWEEGTVHGVDFYSGATQAQRQEIDKILKDEE